MDYFSAYQQILEVGYPLAYLTSYFVNQNQNRTRDNEIKDLQRDLKKYYDSSKHYELLCLKLKGSNHPAQEFVKRQELEIRNLTQVAHTRTLEINNLKQAAEQHSLEITTLKGAVSVLTETKAQQLLDIAQLKETAAAQSRKIMELTETAAAQRRSITELTEPVFHSVSTPTKYDDYFTAEFASLAGDIRQWVFRYFRGGPDVQHQDLPLAAQKSMRAVILGYDAALATIVSAKEIEAAVTQRLSRHIFNRPYVFELCGSSYPLIFDLIGGSSMLHAVRGYCKEL